MNIRQACFYYADNYFALAPDVDPIFQRKFARAIFDHWEYLHPFWDQFDELWIEHKKYIEKIPSFGAIILSKNYEKILFNIYFRTRDEVMKTLDFPKGKADQGEDDMACAVREIKEEVGIDVEPFI